MHWMTNRRFLRFAAGIALLIAAALQVALIHLPTPHLTLLLATGGILALLVGASDTVALTADSWARWRDSGRRLVRQHGVALAAVLAACLVGQIATLSQQPLVGLYPDSVEYLRFARRMLSSHQFTDTVRTPGYPAFLALLHSLAGKRPVIPLPPGVAVLPGGFTPGSGTVLSLIVWVQAALMVIAALEVYVLAYRLSGRRWLAAFIAALVSVNVYALSFERLILTETLCYWLIITIFLVFVFHLRQSSKITYGLLAALSFATIMVRPEYIFLPLLLLVIEALWRLRGRALGQNWKAIVLTFALVYALTAGYAVANGGATGYYGLGLTGEYTVLGKVLEAHHDFGMPLEAPAPQYRRLNDALLAYTQAGGDLSWEFALEHPQYNGQYARYSIEVLLAHPAYYSQVIARDTFLCWLAPQRLWAPWQVGDTTRPALAAPAEQWSPYANLGTWTQWLFVVSDASLLTYFALPALLVILGVWAWRRVEDPAAVAMLTLLLLTTANILVLGMTDYSIEEFDRLRFPGDWAMTLVGVTVLVELIIRLTRALRERRISSLPAEQPVAQDSATG